MAGGGGHRRPSQGRLGSWAGSAGSLRRRCPSGLPRGLFIPAGTSRTTWGHRAGAKEDITEGI